MCKLVSDIIQRDKNNLNFVRLWLAFSVIIGHIPIFIEAKGPKPIFSTIFPFTYCGNIAVLSFFFFSGLLVTNSLFEKKNIKQYIISRFLRIYPALLFVLVISSILCFYFSDLELSIYVKKAFRYIKNVLLMRGDDQIPGVSFIREGYPIDGKFAKEINGSLWIIPYEIKLYTMLLGVYFISSALKSFGKYFVDFVFYIGMFSPFIFEKQLFGGTNTETAYLIPCFCFGGLLAIHKDKIIFNHLIPLGLFLLGWGLKYHQISQLIFFFALVSSALYISTLSWIKKIKIPVDISYGIYIWGWFIQQIIQFYLYHYLNFYTYALVCIIATSIMGLLTYYIVEHPCLKLKKYFLLREKK